MSRPTLHTARHQLMKQTLLFLIALALPLLAQAERKIVGHAIVQDDGSLWIKNKVVHLYGIYMPPTGRHCRSNLSPLRCGSRGALALDFKVKGFIHCFPQWENTDLSVDAICYVDRTSFDPGVDLAEYLLERGWAVALPQGPFQYQAMEKIARSRGMGVWGWQVDSYLPPLVPVD